MLTVLGIIALVACWIAFNLADTISQVPVLLWACIASMFSRD
jgi:hypothetical protein